VLAWSRSCLIISWLTSMVVVRN